MEKTDLLLRAKKILTANGNASAVYFTANNSAFLKEVDARNHAKTLKDNTITTVTREEANGAVEKPKANAAAAAPLVTDKPFTKMNVAELKAEVAKREGLTVADNATKAVMVEAIEKYDADKKAAETANADAAPGADAAPAE